MLILCCLLLFQDPADQDIFNQLQDHLTSDTPAQRLTDAGRFFMGRPYVAKTLEAEGPEQLVTNLRVFDCFTLLESCLALALLEPEQDWSDFQSKLTKLRYRNGEIEGYTSRLHYTSDWLDQGERAGRVKNMSRELGGRPYPKDIFFMSKNPQYYDQLKQDPAAVARMKQVEQLLSKEDRWFLPQDMIQAAESQIKEGDLLAITSTVPGLDIAHVGMAVFENNRLHMLHASSSNKEVEITAKPLADYLKTQKSRHGIMVYRILNSK